MPRFTSVISALTQHDGKLAGESLEPLRPAPLECAATSNPGTLSHKAGGEDTQLRVSSDSHTCVHQQHGDSVTQGRTGARTHNQDCSLTHVHACKHAFTHINIWGAVGKRQLQRSSDDSVVKNSCCSHRRPGLGSQQP